MALYPEDQLNNSNSTDDLLPGGSVFAVPLVRIESITDEMAEGMVIDPKFLPSFADINTLIGTLPIEVTENGDGSYTISIVLDDFILHSSPALLATPPSEDCSNLIATTQFICEAITSSCKVLGPVDGEPNKFDFLDCDDTPFQIEVARNTVVEAPARVFTFTDSTNGSTVIWDVRHNTFTTDGNGLHTWTNPVDGTSHSFALTGEGILVDDTMVPCLPGVTTLSEALIALCAQVSGLIDRFITMTPTGEGALLLADATNGDNYPVMQACSEQRLTDIIPDGSKLVVCTPNDGSYITDIANIVKWDCDAIDSTDIVPELTKVIICTPNDGIFKTDLAALFNCQMELEEGEGIDLDVRDPEGACTLKRYIISVDTCEFSQVAPEEVNSAVAPYWIMCIDGFNAKLSLDDMLVLFRTNEWIDGTGTKLTGTGHPGTPYQIDLAFKELLPGNYDEVAKVPTLGSGNDEFLAPALNGSDTIDIDIGGTIRVIPEPGHITMWAGVVAPAGYLLLDGSAVSRVGEASLFAILGTTYGVGDGSTTYNLPDMRDRVPAGASVTNALGLEVGKDTVTGADIPDHGHTMPSSGAHSHTLYTSSFDNPDGGNDVADTEQDHGTDQPLITPVNGNHTHPINDSAGSGATGDHRQATIYLNFIIKT